jgi:ankyrin repeat protein
MNNIGSGVGNGGGDRSVQRLITFMQWEAAKQRLSEHPEEAFTVAAPLNETALATACRMKASASLISALVKVNPDAAVQTLVTGKTPLHLWCSDLRLTSRGVGFDDDVTVVRTMLTARPSAATVRDADGFLPLHWACAAGPAASLAMFRSLISARPESVIAKNNGGVSPLGMLWSRSALNEEDGRCILSVDAARLHERAADMERIATSRAYNRSVAVRPLGNSAAIWAKILLMARAAYHGTLGDAAESETCTSSQKNDDIFRPLHALAGIDVPASMISFALQVHSNDPGALDEANREGNLALHEATSRRPENHLDLMDADADRGGAITALVNAYPHATRVRNKKGRIPINLAIEAGATWEVGGIRHLLRIYPEALEVKDPASQLYPFMLAAKVGSVEVCFQLLRQCPGLVSRGCESKEYKCR